MKSRKKIKIQISLFLVCLLFLVSGCGEPESSGIVTEQETKSGEYYLYYKNQQGTSLNAKRYKPAAKGDDAIARQMLKELSKNTSSQEQVRSIPEDLTVSYKRVKAEAVINFNKLYYSMNRVDEMLCRSAIVLTLTQLENISSVRFLVEQEELIDDDGKAVGAMNQNDFVDNSSRLIQTFSKADLILYYANDDGTKLKKSKVECVLANNISMEQYVVDRLIEGPPAGQDQATLESDIKVLSVYTQNGVCYVDFDQTFLEQMVNVKDEVTIYSIVNSLCELSTVSQVQILVNGESSTKYHDNISLENPFIRNLDYVESK